MFQFSLPQPALPSLHLSGSSHPQRRLRRRRRGLARRLRRRRLGRPARGPAGDGAPGPGGLYFEAFHCRPVHVQNIISRPGRVVG